MKEAKKMKSQIIKLACRLAEEHPDWTGKQIARYIEETENFECAFRTLWDHCKPSSRNAYSKKSNEKTSKKAKAKKEEEEAEPVILEHNDKYFYNELDDVYIVFSPYRVKPLVVPGETHKAILKAYSWDGEGATVRECSERFGLELQEMRWYLRAFRMEHGKLPLTDEEVHASIDDDEATQTLVDNTLALHRGHIAQRVAKEKWKLTIKQAQFAIDFKQQAEFISNLLTDALGEDLPKIKVPKVRPSDTLSVLPLYDLHIGKLGSTGSSSCYPRETISALLETPTASTSTIVVFGGDFFHIDTDDKKTTRGTLQDTDANPDKILRTAYNEAVWTIKKACQHFETVKIAIVAGNHDHMACLHLREFFTHIAPFIGNHGAQVTVLNSRTENLVVVKHGSNLLAFEHGDGPKPASLMEVLHTLYREAWGATTRTYAHTGHLHHVHERDINGGIIMQQPTSAGADRWHDKNGYVTSEQALRMYEYHTTRGLHTIHHRTV